MRRTVTWIVVAGLAALGLAAAVDALRQEPEEISVAREGTTTDVELGLEQLSKHVAVRQLREAGVSGVLTYSDDECRLHAVSLAELEPVRAPSFESCHPHIPSGGLGVDDGDVVWAGLGVGVIQVVLTREELSRMLGRELGSGPYRARQAASLAKERYAVLAEGRRGRVVAIFEKRRLQRLAAVDLDAGVIRPSPRGRYLAILGSDRGVLVADLDGRGISLPDVAEPHAIAWSPDERWTALAAGPQLFIFPTERTGGPLIRIPLTMRDLDWGVPE